MKKLLYISLAIFATLFLIIQNASAAWYNPFTWGQEQTQEQSFGASVLFPYQGGTGIGTATAGDVGTCIKVLDDSPFTYELGACGTGGGGGSGGTWSTTTSAVAGQLINYPNNNDDIVTIGSNSSTTAEVLFDPNIESYRIGIANTASTTLMGNVYFPSKSQGFAYLGSNSLLSTVASSSILLQDLGGAVTDAQVPDTITVNLAGTATALAANGANCSAGSFPLGVDASGAVETCTDAWTEAENTSAGYVAGTRTLTVAGTANQITSSAGAQDLTANRTWTLSFPNQVIFPQYASTTLGFSTPYASSTSWFGGGLTSCSNGTTEKLLYNSTTGQFSCGTDQNTGSGSSAFEIASTSDIALSQLAYIAKTAGRTTLASVATSTLAVGSSLSSSGTLGYQVGGTNSSLSINTANSNTWSVLQTFNYSSSTAYSSFNVASTTNLIIGGDNFNDLTGTGLAISGNSLTASLGTSIATNEIVGGSTNTVLVTNGADTVAWAKVDLANMVTGTLPIANGGTATTTGRYQGIYFFGGDVFRQASTTGLLDYDPTRQLFTTKYSSSTDYASFVSASSTNLFLGTGQGALYTGSGQRVTVVATSTPTVTAPITYSGTLGQFLGGSSGTFDCTSANGSTKGCITSTDWTTFNNKLGTYDAWSHTLFGGQAGGNFFSATTSMMAIGTSTAPNNLSALTVSSSTSSQLALSAGAGIAQWTMRNAGGNLYFSTTTVAGTATTSTSALTLFGSGVPSLIIGTSTPSSVSNGMVVLGTGAANASTTIQMGKIQFDGYTTAGTRQCVMWTGTAWTSVAGACTQ